MAVLVAGLAAERVRTYDEPFSRDIMTYAVIGHELLLGSRLYDDVVDHKPPGPYVASAAAEALVGYGPAEVYLLNVVSAGAALVGVYLSAARAHDPSIGLGAGLLWLLYGYDLGLEGNQPNTEAFLNGFLSLALGVLYGAGRTRGYAIAGLLIALASFFKLTALLMLPLWGLAFLLGDPGDRRARTAAVRAGALVASAVGAWAAVVAYFWIDGRSDTFRAVVFAFNQDYAGDLGDNARRILGAQAIWPGFLANERWLLVLAGPGLVWGLVARRRAALPVLMYALGAALMVALPGKWWAYYYQLYLPPLILAAAAGLAALRALPRRAAYLGELALLAVAAVGGRMLAAQLQLDGDAASMRKYGPDFVTVREVSRRVDALLAPGESVYMCGVDPGVYFHTRRRPPTRVLWVNHMRGPLRTMLRQSIRGDLHLSRPELIVRDKRYSLEWVPPPVATMITERYVLLDTAANQGITPFELRVRRRGALEKRLAL